VQAVFCARVDGKKDPLLFILFKTYGLGPTIDDPKNRSAFGNRVINGEPVTGVYQYNGKEMVFLKEISWELFKLATIDDVRARFNRANNSYQELFFKQ
jgi:hypothetical protein